MAGLKPEFDKRTRKIVGLSVDPVTDHKSWVKDIQRIQAHAVSYPLIGDADLTVAKLNDMIHPNAACGKRTAVDNAPVRSVFVIGPDKKVKAMIVYRMSTGRNFDEVLRLLDSCQLTSRHTVTRPPTLPTKGVSTGSLRRRTSWPIRTGTTGAAVTMANLLPSGLGGCAPHCTVSRSPARVRHARHTQA